jgi:hypothetical protein
MPSNDNRGIVMILDVTITAVAIEQLSKYVSVESNTRNNKGAVFSLWSVRKVIKNKEDCLSQLSFMTPVCQDMSLGVEEVN